VFNDLLCLFVDVCRRNAEAILIGDALFSLMGLILFYIILIMSGPLQTKREIKDFSAQDISYLSKRIVPAFMLFIVLGLIWSIGSEKAYF